MAATLQELDNFHRFALDQLRQENNVPSLEELLSRWREARERIETNAAIAEGLTQLRSSLGRPLEDFVADFRAELQILPVAWRTTLS